jgi:hypothetical protein
MLFDSILATIELVSRSLISDHRSVWNIVRIIKMWHRDTKWVQRRQTCSTQGCHRPSICIKNPQYPRVVITRSMPLIIILICLLVYLLWRLWQLVLTFFVTPNGQVHFSVPTSAILTELFCRVSYPFLTNCKITPPAPTGYFPILIFANRSDIVRSVGHCTDV